MSSITFCTVFKDAAMKYELLSLAACLFGGVAFAAETLEVARAYHDGGGYDDSWKGTGVPEEIHFKNERILATGKGTYCCGFTFAVAMEVAQERGLLAGKQPSQIRSFQKQWYGATEESREIQCAMAVEKLGIGQRIEPDEALPGDFLQFWRTNKSGHSVVFLDWIGWSRTDTALGSNTAARKAPQRESAIAWNILPMSRASRVWSTASGCISADSMSRASENVAEL
jgi:hypothetical protein